MKPAADLAGVAAAHRVLLDDVVRLGDTDMRRPSLLPGWTVGHVLTHLARNADSHVRRAAGCARDEVVDQYVGGSEGRAAEIETGAKRPAAEIIADVRATNDAFHAAFEALPDDAWPRLSRDVGGTMRRARDLPLRRWQEVEVHHCDLGLAYTWRDWSDAFVARRLPSMLEQLPGRLPDGAPVPTFDGIFDREVLAWCYDRTELPGYPTLRPWG